jgi:hypothetical protein
VREAAHVHDPGASPDLGVALVAVPLQEPLEAREQPLRDVLAPRRIVGVVP